MKKKPQSKLSATKKSLPKIKPAALTNDSNPKIHFTFQNLGHQMEATFDLWTIKNPSLKIQFQRSLIFIVALLATIFWPINNLIIQSILLALAWILLSLTEKPAPRLLLMLNIMLNISLLFYFTRIFIPIY